MVSPTFDRARRNNALGTIGSLAPFHSHRQNKPMTRKPEQRGARTTGDDHGKVTPPYSDSDQILTEVRECDGKGHTQMRGSTRSVHPISVSAAPA